MRDRLIELMRQAENKYLNLMEFEKAILADYLLANGVIVPPCKVGDTLYDISEFVADYACPEMYEIKDNMMSFEKYKGEYRFTYDCCYIYPEEIGKTVFLTREEAEKALNGG